MIEQYAASDDGGGVNIHRELAGHAVLQKQRQRTAVLLPQPVCDAIGLQGMETLEEQERDRMVGAGGVTLLHRQQVATDRGTDARIAGECLFDDFADQQRRRCRAVEILGKMETERCFE